MFPNDKRFKIILMAGIMLLILQAPRLIGGVTAAAEVAVEQGNNSRDTNSLGASQVTQARRSAAVVVFDNSTYVDTTSGSASAESDNIRVSLDNLGYTVSIFTGISDSDFSAALAGQDILVIPELENEDLAPDLSPAAKTVIADFISNGGGLIISSDQSSRATNFLNEVFGFATTRSSGGTSTRSPAAIGTAFESGPTTLPSNSATVSLVTSSLPIGSKSIYVNGSNTTVALIPFGSGEIVFLGWDWYQAAPNGSQDGGWIDVLDKSVQEINGPTNTPPTITSIDDETTSEDTPLGPIPFMIEDAETGAASLEVSATSSDQALIPDSHITLGGSGSKRTIRITPADNANGGPAMITISVSDGTNTSTESFELTVMAVNDAPSIMTSIADQPTSEDTPLGPLSFTIEDIETGAASLDVSATSSDQALIPDSHITLGGSGSKRTIRITPADNANGGPATITISVSDGTDTSTDTFEVTVNPVADDASVTPATTNEDTQTTSGLQISRNGNDGSEVTHFKITGITGGMLYQSDGTTQINDGQFISLAQGSAGLKFTPLANSITNGSFMVQASIGASDSGLGGEVATATITVNPVADTPSVTPAETDEETQTSKGLVISRHDADGAEVTYFQITNIMGGTLYQNDGTTQINHNDFITVLQGNAGLKFTPNSLSNGMFEIQASTAANNSGLGGEVITAIISVNGVANTPSVSDTTTNEDEQSSSGLVISRHINDGAEVTHVKITSITNGTLYKHNGTTEIQNDDFISLVEGNMGLKFTPNAEFSGEGSFMAQASTTADNGGLGGNMVKATITVNPVADDPSVTGSTTNEDTQTTSGLQISRNGNDGSEVSHFKISNITGGMLYQNNGTTQVSDGQFITFAQGNAGLKFTPTVDSTADGSFVVQASIGASDSGLGGEVATATITVNPVADTPLVSGAATDENTQTSNGLLIARHSGDGPEVSHFKITNITGGTLYQNDGTTQINNSQFITFAQGNAGLKFTPNSLDNGRFTVQASIADNDMGLGGEVATATIMVRPVAETPSITSASTNEDEQSTSGLQISRHGNDGAEVTYFRITDITGGTLYQNNGTTQINDDEFITFAQGNAGLKFTPSPNSIVDGGFVIRASTADNNSGLGGDLVTAMITVNPVADTPSVTNATTNEDMQTSSGLVIERNEVDGPEVTHFRITNITGGTLYQNNGTTEINENQFITFAEGNAGLKFTPSPNSTATGSFTVQASTTDQESGLDGDRVSATIMVYPAVDTPQVSPASTDEDTQTTSGLVIDRNANDGAEITHFKITNIAGGTLYHNNGTTEIQDGQFITYNEGQVGLKFTPSPNSTADGSFMVQASTANQDSGLGGNPIQATIEVTAVNDAPVLDNSADVALTEIDEDEPDSDNSGTLVSSLIVNHSNGQSIISDPDADAREGIAVIEVDNRFGRFEFKTNDGTSWQDLGTPSENSATLLAPTANIRFVPDPNFNGLLSPAMTFRAWDQSSGNNGDSGVDVSTHGGITAFSTVTESASITVNSVNDPPVAEDDSITVIEDEEYTLLPLSNDHTRPDVDEVLFISTLTQGDHGGKVINFNTYVKYTPVKDFFGVETFSYTIKDGRDGSDTATFTITVTNVNDDPTAIDDLEIEVEEDSIENEIDVLNNDLFEPDENETLTITEVGQSESGGSVEISDDRRHLIYTPFPDYFGPESFSYTISDGNGGSSTANVMLTVINVNDDPTGNDDRATVEEDSSGNVLDVLANDEMTPDRGETLIISEIVSQPDKGGTVTNQDTHLTYTPAKNFSGDEQFSYKFSDGNGGEGMANVIVSVEEVNDAPTAEDNTFAVDEDEATGTSLGIVEASDVEDDSLSYQIIEGDSNNHFFINPNTGEISVDSDLDFEDIPLYNLTVKVADSGTLHGTATITINIGDVNEAPTVNEQTFSVEENSPTGSPVDTVDAMDVDQGDSLTYSIIEGDPNEEFTINDNTGEISVKEPPDISRAELYELMVQVEDSRGGLTDTALISININNVIEAPTQPEVTSISEGGINIPYNFTMMVQVEEADLPITYTWEVTNHESIINVTETFVDTQTYKWMRAGEKTVEITVGNDGGTITESNTLTMFTSPPPPPVPGPGTPTLTPTPTFTPAIGATLTATPTVDGSTPTPTITDGDPKTPTVTATPTMRATSTAPIAPTPILTPRGPRLYLPLMLSR